MASALDKFKQLEQQVNNPPEKEPRKQLTNRTQVQIDRQLINWYTYNIFRLEIGRQTLNTFYMSSLTSEFFLTS